MRTRPLYLTGSEGVVSSLLHGTRGGPTYVHETLKVQCIDVIAVK